MIITRNIDVSKPLTKKQLKMLEEMEKAPIVFDEDCPELTDEELSKFRRVSENYDWGVRKETVTLRLSPQTVKKAKALGKGYTSILARIIENALKDPESLEKSLNI